MVSDSMGRRIRAALAAAVVAAGTAAVLAYAPGTAAAAPEAFEPSSVAGSLSFSLPDVLTSFLDQLGLGSSSTGSTGSLGSSATGSFGSSYGSVVDSPSA